MKIVILKEKINQNKLKALAEEGYGEMVKGVVDVNQKKIALGGELHADVEALLLEKGSKQEYLWGFNIYVNKQKGERLEYSSFINIRPGQGNRSMEIKDEAIRNQIQSIVDELVE